MKNPFFGLSSSKLFIRNVQTSFMSCSVPQDIPIPGVVSPELDKSPHLAETIHTNLETILLFAYLLILCRGAASSPWRHSY